MTTDSLPAWLADLRNAAAAPHTCTCATIDFLKDILLRKCPDEQKSEKLRHNGLKNSVTCRDKKQAARRQKPGDFQITEDLGRQAKPLSVAQQLALATEIVNSTLKSLAVASKEKSDKSVLTNVHNTPKCGPPKAISSPRLIARTQTPLGSVSANIHVRPRESPSKRQRNFTKKHEDGVRAQILCAKAAFESLLILQDHDDCRSKKQSCQVEKGISALIHRCIALKELDLGLEVLRLLRVRLLHLISGGECLSKARSVASRHNIVDDYGIKTEPIANMIGFGQHRVPSHLLPLISTTQLQIIRLLALGLDCEGESLLKQLDAKNPTSPINTIVSQVKDQASKEKAAHELEMLAQLIRALCGHMACDNKQCSDASVLSTFRLQCVSLVVQRRWWDLVDHKVSNLKEVWLPFSHFVKTFEKSSSASKVEKYRSIRKAFELIKDGGVFRNFQDQDFLPIYQKLTEIAQSAALNKESRHWLEMASACVGGADSPLRRCIMSCQLATLHVRETIQREASTLEVELLEQVGESFSVELHGESQELQELFVAISSLRKSVFSFVVMRRQALGDQCAADLSPSVVESLKVTSVCMRFISRYFGHDVGQNGNTELQQHPERLSQLLSTVVVPAIEDIYTLSKIFGGGCDELWRYIDRSLTDSTKIVTVLFAHGESGNPFYEGMPDKKSLVSKISASYWLRYQHLKRQDDKLPDTTKCLRSSIDILQRDCLTDDAYETLMLRRESYARLYESIKQMDKALEVCRQSIQLHIERCVVQAVSDAARNKPLPAAFEANNHTRLLRSSLQAYLRIAFKAIETNHSTSIYFDPQHLVSDQRIILLSYQFSVLLSHMEKNEPCGPAISQAHNLASDLHRLFSNGDFPVRRLFFITQLLYFRLTQPISVEASIILSELKQHECPLRHIFETHDKDLEPYLGPLNDQVTLLKMINMEPTKLKDMEKILSSWLAAPKERPDGIVSQRKVYDERALESLLGLMFEYLDYQRFPLLATLVLRNRQKVNLNGSKEDIPNKIATSLQLGIQYDRLGHPELALHSVQGAKPYLEDSAAPVASTYDWHIAMAWLYLNSDQIDLCRIHVDAIRGILQENDQSENGQNSLRRRFAEAHQVHSRLAAREGSVFEALWSARYSVKSYDNLWTIQERRAKRAAASLGERKAKLNEESLTDDFPSSFASEGDRTSDESMTRDCFHSITFWRLGASLVEALIHLSDRLCHIGLFSEVDHYLQEALKVAKASQAPKHIAQCYLKLAEHALRADSIDVARDNTSLAQRNLESCPMDYETAKMQLTLVKLYGEIREVKSATSILNTVRRFMTQQRTAGSTYLSVLNVDEQDTLQARMAMLSLMPTNGSVTKTRTNVKSKTFKLKDECRLPTSESQSLDSQPLSWLQSLIHQHEAMLEFRTGNTLSAEEFLLQADSLPSCEEDKLLRAILRSDSLLRRGLKAIAASPVFSILPESTISHPGVIQRSQQTVSKPTIPKRSRQLQRKGDKKILASKTHEDPAQLPFEMLQECRKSALKLVQTSSHQMATNIIHQVSRTLTKALMMLAILPHDAQEGQMCPKSLSLLAEIPRVDSILRASLHVQMEKKMISQPTLDLARPEFEYSSDFPGRIDLSASNFSSDFLKTIPESWNVVCLTLGETEDELLVSKLRHEHPPFHLKIPFKRASVVECDEAAFGFTEAKQELMEIVQLANQSSQDGGNIVSKSDKSAWWNLRRGLDDRLGNLLQNVETIWLGGFRGIFNTSIAATDSLAKFERSLHLSLGKYLPSRQRSGISTIDPHMSLDTQIVQFFVALGAPSDDNDIDEALLDLMYFVADTLQFKGERNAYDEIDFDSLVIETLDALRQYHLSSQNSDESEQHRQHTILVLDKSLHCFPWESLPCLKGQNVSRVPSLMCLQQRLLRQRMQQDHPDVEGGHPSHAAIVPRHDGAYILNPSGDLGNTQDRFEEPLSKLVGWNGITGQQPSEDQFKDCLERSDIFLYFGHGSGGQYIRSRTIKKLDKCAVSLLMGCSSGLLNEAGEYEPYGKPIDYMLAGSPAMLANLWDVTDKDIDKFAQSVLEKWGLFRTKGTVAAQTSPQKRGKRSKGKGVATEAMGCAETGVAPMTLDECVSQSRDVCILKYLNGAAPVIYGIPVLLE